MVCSFCVLANDICFIGSCCYLLLLLDFQLELIPVISYIPSCWCLNWSKVFWLAHSPAVEAEEDTHLHTHTHIYTNTHTRQAVTYIVLGGLVKKSLLGKLGRLWKIME